MSFSSQVLQFILSGLTLGGIYALIGLGFVTTYNVTGILNFAQGEFVMLGALITVALVGLKLPILLAIVLAVLVVALIGALMERLAIYPARHASLVTVIIITIGVSISIRGLALLIWGTDPYSLPAFSTGSPLSFAGASMTPQAVWVIGTAVAVVTALFFFFERTYLGKAVRACVVNKLAARLMGISPQLMSLLAVALSAGLGAIAGIVITPITLATYDMGLMLGLKGFVAAVLGGLTSISGAVLGGFLLGVLEALGSGLISSGYKDAIAFLILVLVLFIKPSGLLGSMGSKRV
ncbi:MAG: branched-chain amino acid ABC transporter permease [Clostridia bacterium]|nr:branched-chain amino acid ABC transporter permease [Clostridia bacterium]